MTSRQSVHGGCFVCVPHGWCTRSRRSRPWLWRAIIAASSFAAVAFCLPPAADASSAPLSITTTSLSSGEVGAGYFEQLEATGATAPYSWSTTSSLPEGLALSSRGVLSGTPQASIDEVVAVTVSDSSGATASGQLTLGIAQGPTISTTALPSPVLGEPYASQLAATGGTPPYVWSVTSGPLPLGLVLGSGGLLSGLPSAAATTETTITLTDALGSRVSAVYDVTVTASLESPQAYLVTSRLGGVSAFANPGTSVPQTAQDGPSGVVAIAADPGGDGYWLAMASGAIEASPGERSLGSVGRRHLSGHIVGLATTPDGSGYWLASSTGHVYGFGSARSLGSVPPTRLSGHIVGLATTPDGSGYWLASSTGHVYRFGAAHVFHHRGRQPLRSGAVGIAADPSGGGYWLVSAAGRVVAYGHAPIEGSVPRRLHLRSVVGIAPTPDGAGYWLVTRGGVVEAFGTASLLPGVEIAPGSGAVAIASVS